MLLAVSRAGSSKEKDILASSIFEDLCRILFSPTVKYGMVHMQDCRVINKLVMVCTPYILYAVA